MLESPLLDGKMYTCLRSICQEQQTTLNFILLSDFKTATTIHRAVIRAASL